MSIWRQLYKKSSFHLNNIPIPKVDSIIYLGSQIDNKLNFIEQASEKFKNVQKKYFHFFP